MKFLLSFARHRFQIAEITRVLRSGGVFVGTTFLRYTPATPRILRPLREVNLHDPIIILPVVQSN